MDGSRTPEEIFLDTMRVVLKEPTLSLEQAMTQPLAKTLFTTIAQAAESAAPAAPTPKKTASSALSAFASSRAVMQAGIEDTFEIGDLPLQDHERTALLAASDIVMIQGNRRLRLRDADRAEILRAVANNSDYRALLQEAGERDKDDHQAIGVDPIRLPSAWLRCFLSGDFMRLDNAPPRELKAALAARARLRLVTDLPRNVPTLDDLERRVGLADLLEPLRLLIGAEGGWDGTPPRDRFVGRASQIRQLRAFVDELASQNTFEALGRLTTRTRRGLTGTSAPDLLILEARGGLGKSTLLAKFVLDHALAQSRPFPFAYLDFDRAGIDPDRPRQLLLEIIRQVGLQFPAAKPDFDKLTADLRIELARQSVSAVQTASNINDPFAQFAEILREHAIFGERAFLLVLDTLEVVQWNAPSMESLADLVDEFRRKGLDELRVVASGRADVPELRRGAARVERIRLTPLVVKEARDMAEALGRATIGDEWQSAWSAAIAGKAADNDVRREPLAVRVAVDLVARAAPDDRPRLADEIAKSGTEAGEDFVARLYERRVVNHVRDEKARRLAWPGLVVRRVTLEIAQELLAPLCGIAPGDVEDAYKSLGREVWMVEDDGKALRHRPDLRARTLPLMRKMDGGKRFEEIAREAVEYFYRHRDRSREDYLEWMYHRLLIGDDPHVVEGSLTSDLLPLLARAGADFPPGSPAANYIAARTSRTRLSPGRIAALQPDDALHHLRLTSAGSFALDDLTLDIVTLDVSDRIRSARPSEDGDLYPWARALWIKTGAWLEISTSTAIQPAMPGPLLRAHVLWAARLSPRLGPEQRTQLLDACWQAMAASRSNEDRPGFRTTVQAMALARLAGSDAFKAFDGEVAGMLSGMQPNPAPSTQAALRTAIVLGDASREPALRLWLASRRRGRSDRVRTPTISRAELDALAAMDPDAADLLPESDRDMGYAPTRFTDETIVAGVSRVLEDMPGASASGAAAERTRRALSRVFACRDEDWLVPLGYAAARALAGKPSEVWSRRLASYEPRVKRLKVSAPAAPVGDVLAAIRVADEASDLAGFSRVALGECDPQSLTARELSFLLDCREAWNRAVRMLVTDIKDTEAPVEPPAPLADRPPAPGPVRDPEDLQKGRWGGRDTLEGRTVRAELESVERDIFYFSVIVESIDDTPLAPPVVFHLHDSYPKSVVTIRHIIDRRQALLSDWNAHGVFAIGVQVKNAGGAWISLELDLSKLAGLPKRFLDR